MVLNDRRQAILELIVDDYIQTAAPVASQQIARRHSLRVSAATVRNDMAELEEMGYIRRPHTSAGGVPADMGYRFYVEQAVVDDHPPAHLEALAGQALHDLEAGDSDRMAREATSVLSRAIRNAAVATAPRAYDTRLKQLQLVHLKEGQALLVAVMQEARVLQHMVHFDHPVDQPALTQIANRLNSLFQGASVSEMRALWADEPRGGTADRIVQEAVRLLEEESGALSQRLHVDGLRHMLAQPEFADSGRAREAVETLEDRERVGKALEEDLPEGEVRVIIGGENASEQMRRYSVIISRYGRPGRDAGALAVIGPTRLDYARAIASVRYLSAFMTRLIESMDNPAA